MKKAKIGIVSLGCPKNQTDAEVMLKALADKGYEITGEDSEADVIIVNTCAFIESAKQESIDNILDVAWLKEHGKLRAIIVTGCLAERYRDEIFESIPEVDAVVGCGGLFSVCDAVEAVLNKKKYSCYDPVENLPLGGDRVVTTPEHYAYLKIAEGCDNRCTYCAIPYIRGRFRSREKEDIIAEAKELEALGAKEIILIAQDTTRYGEDIYGKLTLPSLIHDITDNTEKVKIRLLYCYPDKITDELISEIKENDRVLKYIDLPVQHISEQVLKRMGRKGGAKAIRDAISRLREIDGMILRTTLITGFPGETEEDFEELCDFVSEVKFERLGVFPYSREVGTPAYDMPDQIDEEVKTRRADIIMQAQMAISCEFNEKQIGREFSVVVDDYDPVSECYFGRSYMDAPEIDGKIFFSAEKGIKAGQEVKVKINDVLDYDLIGEKI